MLHLFSLKVCLISVQQLTLIPTFSFVADSQNASPFLSVRFRSRLRTLKGASTAISTLINRQCKLHVCNFHSALATITHDRRKRFYSEEETKTKKGNSPNELGNFNRVPITLNINEPSDVGFYACVVRVAANEAERLRHNIISSSRQ